MPGETFTYIYEGNSYGTEVHVVEAKTNIFLSWARTRIRMLIHLPGTYDHMVRIYEMS